MEQGNRPTDTLKIILVEDSPEDADLIVMRLKREGFQFDWQRVDSEAEYLLTLESNPDLILADWHLPGFGGMRALQIRSERDPHIPFIIVSGSIGEETAVEAMKLGAHDYILKDRPERIGQAVRNALEQQQILERNKKENEAREKSESALRESEQRYRTLFETMTTGVLYQDRTGRLLSANPAALKVLGMSWEDITTKGPPEAFFQLLGEDGLILPADKRPGYLAMLSGKAVEDVVVGIFDPSTQTNRWLLTTAIPQFLDGEDAPSQVYITFNDITELRQAQENLRQTHQQLNAIIQASPLGISAIDQEGRVTLWSPATERLFGWTQAEVLGRELPIVPETYKEEVLHQIREEIQGIARTGLENPRLHKDGTLLDISFSTAPLRDAQGKISGSMAIYENITERKRSEAQLHMLSAALEAAANAIEITDLYGTIEWTNPAYTRLTGYSLEEVRGKNPRILKSGFQDAQFYKNLWDTILAGKVWQNELVNRRKDGSFYNEEEIITPLMDKEGRITHFIGVKQDITERKQHERELETVSMVSSALRSATSQSEMLPVILDQLLSLLNVEGATVELLDPDSGDISIELGRGAWELATGERIPRGEGLSAEVIATRQPYLNNDLGNDPRLFRPDLSIEIRAAAGTLLMAQNQVIGLLWIGSQRALTGQDLRLLTAIADMAANAIHRAMLHEQTEHRLRQLAALRKIDQAITNSFDLHVVLRTVVEQVATQLQVDAVAVLLYDPQTFILRYGSGYGFQYEDIEQTSLLLGEGLAGRAAIEKRTISSPYLVTEISNLRRVGMVQKEGFISHHVTPVIVKQQLKGVLEVFHRARLRPDQEWLGFFEAFADQAAIAIDNAQLFEGLHRSNLNLTLAYDATIEGWSRAMDLRDKDTENHTRRVTELTLLVADLMGVSQKEIIHVRRGALLHDIGKLGVPDTILLKTEKLTPEEWVTMRKHPQFAYDMLSSVEYLVPALDIPYCHHEKWDGSGYPRGLSGEEIPFSARLFAVVDVYDALTSDRPYRKAWTHQTALDYIYQESGRHFDPEVVKVFLKSHNYPVVSQTKAASSD